MPLKKIVDFYCLFLKLIICSKIFEKFCLLKCDKKVMQNFYCFLKLIICLKIFGWVSISAKMRPKKYFRFLLKFIICQKISEKFFFFAKEYFCRLSLLGENIRKKVEWR
eukprot:Pompholyxophrys_punicea_v1_NODE_76_length_3723_cov_6.341769.p2 type:complete len:109 gc:universal NODE_76_length_3723_cov_6.341769:3040-2714(-)